jgi:hypothetical protein
MDDIFAGDFPLPVPLLMRGLMRSWLLLGKTTVTHRMCPVGARNGIASTLNAFACAKQSSLRAFKTRSSN